MYGIHLDSPKSIKVTLAPGKASMQRVELLELLKGITKNVAGKENDCDYECIAQPNERTVLIGVNKESFGSWWAEYSVITADLWLSDAGEVTFISRNIWGPQATDNLYSEDAERAGDAIHERLNQAIEKANLAIARPKQKARLNR